MTGVEPRFVALLPQRQMRRIKRIFRFAQYSFRGKTQIANVAICVFHGFSASSSPPTRKGTLWVPSLGEMTGGEPVSKNPLIQLSPGAGCLLSFSYQAPAVRLLTRATVLCMTGSTVKGLCMFTTDVTLSLGSWSYREERVTRRSRHCHR